MKAWGTMASSVILGLVFTVDYPDNHDNKRVPVLDFELWCEEEKGSPRLLGGATADPRPRTQTSTASQPHNPNPVTRGRVQDAGCGCHQISLVSMWGQQSEKESYKTKDERETTTKAD